MPESVSNYFLGVVPPEGFRRELATLQSLHAIKAPRTMAHITIHAPFPWRADRTALAKAVRPVCEATPSFEARLEGAGHFRDRVVYVTVHPHEPFSRLHESVRRALGAAPSNRKPFHPHLTFAKRFRTPERFDHAWRALEGASLAATFEVQELTLFAWTDGVRWDPAGTFPLRG